MVILNQDNQDINIILDIIHEQEGYCPCVIEKNDDTKCMCKAFREQQDGMCECGVFIKVKGS